MQIPAFKKTATDAVELQIDGSIDSAISVAKTLPPLAVFPISASVLLRRFYRFFYSAFCLSLFIAFFPSINSPATGILACVFWFVMLLCACVGLWFLCARQCSAIPFGTLAYENGFWVLCEQQKQSRCVLVGEVLCWPWLIILPLQSEAGRKRFLLLCHDALQPADQARLRTWLRACLKPKS